MFYFWYLRVNKLFTLQFCKQMLPPVEYPDNVDFHLIMSGPHVNVPLPGHSIAGCSDDDGDGDD